MSGTLARLPVMIVALVIGLILTFTAVMPLVSDYSDAKTFTNEGYYRMSKLDSESEYKLFWDHSNPYQVTINDTEIISLSDIPLYAAVSIVASDLFSFRFLNEPTNPRVQMYGGLIWGFGGASVSNATDFTITVSNGSMTGISTAETPYSVTSDLPTNTYAIDKEGSNVMKKSNVDAYVLQDSSIIAICGITETGGLQAGVFGSGTVEDGLDYYLFRPGSQSDTATFSNENITYSDVDGYIDLVKLSKIEFTVTLSDGDLSPVYTYFIVPYEVTADPDNPAAYKNLVSVLPLFALILLVAGAASLVYFKNKD